MKIQDDIIDVSKNLLSFLKSSASMPPQYKIDVIDEQITKLESAIELIQINWIPKEKRLERLLSIKETLDSKIQHLEKRINRCQN